MKWFFLILGAVVFAVGLTLFLRAGQDRAALRRYGLCAYLGLGTAVLCAILLLEPVLSRAPAILTWGAAFAVFILAGSLLLRPGFRKKP